MTQDAALNPAIPTNFFVTPAELTLDFAYPQGQRRLGFKNTTDSFEAWQPTCRAKLQQLLALQVPARCAVREVRELEFAGVRIKALIMHVSDTLTIPAYLLLPGENRAPQAAVMAIHGHGEVEPCIGLADDYHHQFALQLAQRGYLVLCPELRGFGVLKDLARHTDGSRLDYWQWESHMAYSLVTDGIQHARTLIGETIEDLLRWEQWLVPTYGLAHVHAVRISYGGDLALTYPVFSAKVNRIFASGTLGSFEPIFARCYNAPAHCIPGVLEWMDRADIAGLNAPRPVAIHYGELDIPGPTNFSASFNETVAESVADLKTIYAAVDAETNVSLIVSAGKQHEMDIEAVSQFLNKNFQVR